jgi:hypothetical protein
MRGGHPGRHHRDAERQVEDDPDGGDEASPLAPVGQCGQDAVGAREEPRADARARHRGAGQERSRRCGFDRGQGHHGAGEQGQAAGQHGHGAVDGAERDRSRGPRPGDQEDHQAAPHKVRRAKHLRGQRRAQGQVKAIERGRRDHARQRHRERPACLPRDGHPRPERGGDAAASRRGLRDRQHGDGGDGGSAQEQPPDQMGGRRRVLHQRTGAEAADAQAQEDGCAGDHRGAPAAPGLQVDQRRAGRACRDAHRCALQRPGREKQPDAVRGEEQPARARAGR